MKFDLVAVMLLLGCVAAEQSSVKIEHIFCDPLQPSDTAGTTTPPSLVAKPLCKGNGCPSLHNHIVSIVGCRWGSVNGRQVRVEETSGWYFFYDARSNAPLRPTEAERKGDGRREEGYLKGPSDAGTIQF